MQYLHCNYAEERWRGVENMCASFLVNTCYPPDKTNEITQIIIKSGPLPSHIKLVGDSPYATPTEDGTNGFSICEFPDEKMGEAVKDIAKMMAKFYSVVGFRWTAQIIFALREAFQIHGLITPTR
jgi:hypothetical protein